MSALEASQSRATQNTHLIAIRPGQGGNLFPISVVDLLHDLLHLLLTGLDIDKKQSALWPSLSLQTQWPGRTNDRTLVKIVVLQGEQPVDFLLIVMDIFQHCLLGLKSLLFGFVSGRTVISFTLASSS